MIRLLLIIGIISCIACQRDKEAEEHPATVEETTQIAFDQTLWQTGKDGKYPFRAQMVDSVLYNDTIRSLNGEEILELLGDPDKVNEGHLYYTISQRKLGAWPLHTKTLVVKLSDENSIEWIKLHE